jgi:hypothetical protein
MLAHVAYAAQPTKTLAQGGWFAIGGPGEMVDTLCGGAPCTNQAFAFAFGPVVSNMQPQNAALYESRDSAVNALMSGDFSINGQMCQPGVDTGQTGALVSGFVHYYMLSDFTYEQLAQSAGLPSSESLIFQLTQAISMWLSNHNLGALATHSGGPLINPDNGQPIDMFSYQDALTDLGFRDYGLIASWARNHGAVVNGFNVTNLLTTEFICP